MIFLLGGARSGKSKLAVAIAEKSGQRVRLLATAAAIDEEMERRISSHRANRPSDWVVVEEPIYIARALAEAAPDETVVLDCVTLWISNLMMERNDADIMNMVGEAARIASARISTTVVVSNEVGEGLVPMDPVGRRFRDLQGTANQVFATEAETAYLVVAGRTLELDRTLAK
ncbi:MAG TPA: bifunctional adenosylcobinamide kinase/adenosylcobinamide-phosphate guanylyltransferase [Acidimicrobiia bacterium]|nr:bifunctional adenosylcobinamide kinase/adenosylcobinamide-phosphate guanylyltransferase [Acidimicrobiia bacterium]